jgi:hypothetical protein
LIADHLRSVMDLECLLALYADPQRDWSAEELGRKFCVDERWVTHQLADLAQRGVLSASQTAPTLRYRYAGATPAMNDAVAELARLYATRRVAVIELIYSKPADPLQSFADAFRLRKEKSDG